MEKEYESEHADPEELDLAAAAPELHTRRPRQVEC